MDSKTEEKIRRLTENQARALKAVVEGTASGDAVTGTYISNATGLTANALGGTVSALERNDFIQPLGRDGRQFKWELEDQDLIKAQSEDPRGLNNILSRVAGEK